MQQDVDLLLLLLIIIAHHYTLDEAGNGACEY